MTNGMLLFIVSFIASTPKQKTECSQTGAFRSAASYNLLIFEQIGKCYFVALGNFYLRKNFCVQLLLLGVVNEVFLGARVVVVLLHVVQRNAVLVGDFLAASQEDDFWQGNNSGGHAASYGRSKLYDPGFTTEFRDASR